MVQIWAHCMHNSKHTGCSDCYLDYNSTGWKTGISMKKCFALGLPSQGKPWRILLKDVNSTSSVILWLLEPERLKRVLVSPWRQRKANYVYHNIPPTGLGDFSSSHKAFGAWELQTSGVSPQTQTSVYRAVAKHLKNKRIPSPWKIWFDPWRSDRKKKKQSMWWSENSIRNSLSTRSPGKAACAAWLWLRARLQSPAHISPLPVIWKAARLTLWTCGPSVPQNDIFHSNGGGHFLI